MYPIESRRHSAAHVMAAAIKHLFPEAKFGVGPVIENGFYYDIDIGRPVTPEDLKAINKEMRKIVNQNPAFTREELPIDDAIKLFRELDQTYKLELLNDLKTKGTTKVSVEESQDIDPQNVGSVTLYRTGDFVDLCRGPHVTEAKEIGAWKLTKIAGAYWRGKETNPQMQRIYGLCFETEKELDEYEAMLVEAEKRDHRKLGQELDLFVIDEKVGKGLPLWTPRGTAVKFALEEFARELERKYGYEHIETPYLGAEELYRTSGHLDHYAHNMYASIDMDGDKFYLRPMACPHHIRMYQRRPWSYKELPIRYAEIADYNRYEKSGELIGMIRVRKFQLTDGHLFVTPEGLKDEFKNVCRMIVEGMNGLGLIDIVSYRFSKRDPNNKEKYYPDDELWDHAESLMREALDELGLPYVEAEDEAAFYGPKLDVQAKNVNGKEDTLFTAQMDFLLPQKFDMEYIDRDGQKKRPVMIHRSTIGSLERVFGFLIEHYAGAFPMWLAPVQIAVLPVADRHVEFAKKLAQELRDLGLRVMVDDSSESVGKKIRAAEKQKFPRMLVVGDREADGGALTVRVHGEKDQQEISKEKFVEETMAFVKSRRA